jgi:hypothetical protein
MAVTGIVRDASAIPAFTRKFDMDCSHCHTVAPGLNDFGEKFRDHGHQIAGLADSLPEELREPGNQQSTVTLDGNQRSSVALEAKKEDPEDLHPAYWPISLRAVLGYRQRSFDHQNTVAGEAKIKTRGSGIDRLELMWGGLLAKDVNFYVTYRPSVANAAFGEPAHVVRTRDAPGGQEGELESAWVRFDNLAGSPWLNLKLGSFEMDVPVSAHRRLTVSSYPIYGYFPFGSQAAADGETAVNWSEHQLGAELMGHGASGLRYAIAAINGANARADNNTALDYYGRVSRRFGDHRFGAFGYWGAAPTQFQQRLDSSGSPVDILGTGTANKTFSRLGLDGDVRVAPLRLLFVGVHGSDSKDLFGLATPQEAAFNGGFVEAQYDLIKDWDTILVARYDIIRNSAQGDALTPKKTGDLDGVTLAARYNLLYTRRVNVVLHGEYSHVQTKLTSTLPITGGNDQNDNRMMVAFDLMM